MLIQILFILLLEEYLSAFMFLYSFLIWLKTCQTAVSWKQDEEN